MRIWSIHPKYVDTKGLVALWRETLLAKHVLEGKTKGYKNHPQLNRFKAAEEPLHRINNYLACVFEEASQRGYNFDKDKIHWDYAPGKLSVTRGQLEYERKHLLGKLKVRDVQKYTTLKSIRYWDTHPMFVVVDGGIEDWEVI